LSLKDNLKLKLLLIFGITFSALYFIFTKPIKLGLDLQGGMSITLQVDINHVIKRQYQLLAKDIEKKLTENKIEVLSAKINKEEGIIVSLLDPTKLEESLNILRKEYPHIDVQTDDGVLIVKFKEWELRRIKEKTIKQEIEILRNRIDEFGTLNPNIARKGEDRIIVELPGVVDPERAKAIIT